MTAHTPRQAAVMPNVPDGIAADLLMRLLKDPFASSADPRLEDLDEQESNWLKEVAVSLGIPRDKALWSESDLLRFRNALAHSLERGPTTPDRARAARGRLGNAGLLRASEYKIEWPDSLRDFESFGERRTHIERAIFEADVVQHLSNRGQDTSRQTEGITLFVRMVTPNAGSEFAHLVVMNRKEATLRFMASWRVIRRLVEWTPEMTALDLLKRFVDVFGLPFQAVRGYPTKFLLHDAVPWDGKSSPQQMLKVMAGPVADFRAQFAVRLSADLGVLEVALAYVIDVARYKKAMVEHGLLKA